MTQSKFQQNKMASGKAYNPLQVSPQLYQYALDSCLRENEFLHELRAETEKHWAAMMLSDPIQVQFMTTLLKLIGAKRGIEVGVFTGYTSLAFALTIPEDGEVLALDVSEEFTSIGRKYWEKAGVANKINLILAPAVETLQARLPEQAGTYDWIYIDADKSNYLNYYKLGLQLVRPGGLILIDNVLWHGEVINPQDTTFDTVAIREVNEYVKNDKSVDPVLLTVGDGLFVALKK